MPYKEKQFRNGAGWQYLLLNHIQNTGVLIAERLCLNIFSPDKPRVGGSDSYREPNKVFGGPEYLAEGTFSGLAAARVGSVLSKLCRPFLSNLRVGFLETLRGHGLALLLMFPFWVYGVKLTELQCQGVIEQIVYIVHSQAFILLPKLTRI